MNILSKLPFAHPVAARYFFHLSLPRGLSARAPKKSRAGQLYAECGQWANENSVRVETTASDGLRLVGHYISAENPVRTLILFHGWRSAWDYELTPAARALHAEGCNLLMVEQRAHGESDGSHLTMGITERKDCAVWAEWLEREHPDGLPVYLYGISMGGATVSMAAGEPLPASVRGVISDCCFDSPVSIFSHLIEKSFRFPVHPFIDEMCDYTLKKIGVDLRSYSTLEAMKTCSLPILFIHGGADTFVPTEMTRRTYEACTSMKKMLIVKDASHACSYMKAPNLYMDTLRRFFAEVEGAV